ncbi:MAG: hypothetical protein NZ602_11500, partial [Thermoguttaceae bacterium]|nr:hypothetical protein [Thermoguttaceae bacterium]
GVCVPAQPAEKTTFSNTLSGGWQEVGSTDGGPLEAIFARYPEPSCQTKKGNQSKALNLQLQEQVGLHDWKSFCSAVLRKLLGILLLSPPQGRNLQAYRKM